VKVLDDKWTVVTLDGKLSAHYENTIAVTQWSGNTDQIILNSLNKIKNLEK
jgi:methionine aminopeptidase